MATDTSKQQVLLYPETISKRRLPINLQPENLPLFEGELLRVIPQTTLNTFRDVRITPEGLLFDGNQVLPESFAFASNYNNWKLRSRIKLFINNSLLRRERSVTRQVLWIINDWSSSYFHWLTDALSRLYVMRDRLEELVLMLPYPYERLDFVRSSLRCFTTAEPEFIGPNEVLRCARVVMPSETAPPGHYNEEIIRGVRALICKAYGDLAYDGRGERIYISRSRASKRKIENEEEIVPLLSTYGFETVYAEDLSFEQQVKLFSRTRYIVSNHGAGLTNMLFALEGSNILELRQAGDRIRNYYFGLSSALNHNYFYQTCQSAPDNFEPHLANLVVNPVLLRENLRLLVEP